jgi:hypothetical protein
MSRRVLGSALALSLVVLVAGCPAATNSPVTGKMTLDGTPLAGAEIEFEKRDKEGVGKFSARSDAEGKFKVAQIAGRTIAPGTYQVLVTKWVDPKGKITEQGEIDQLRAAGLAKNVVPEKYADTASTPLKADIKAGSNELAPFDLKSK